MKEKLSEIIENAGYLRQYPGTMARILIENGVTIQKWIPVSERLPETQMEVLVYTGTEMHIRSFFDVAYVSKYGVTHWMPLPGPPKEGANDGKE